MSKNCSMYFNECELIAGNINFEDEDTDHHLVDCEIIAKGTNNLLVSRCRTKSTRCIWKAPTTNVVSDNSSFVMTTGEVRDSQYNFEGSFKEIKQESFANLCSVDCYKHGLTCENYVAKRGSIIPGSHPFNGCTLDNAWFEHLSVQHTGYLMGNNYFSKNVSWARMEYIGIEHFREEIVSYGGWVHYIECSVKGDHNTVGQELLSEKSRIQYAHLTVNEQLLAEESKLWLENTTIVKNLIVEECPIVRTAITNISENLISSLSALDLNTTTIAKELSMTNTVAKTYSVTSGNTTATSSNGDMVDHTSGTFDLFASNFKTFGGSFSETNVDAASTLNSNGTGNTVNTPTKNGVAVNSGIVSHHAGSDTKTVVSGNWHMWVEGNFWIRVGGNEWHRVEGSLLESTLGSATYTSSGPINLTSPPRTPAEWVPGGFTPLEEPPA